MQAANKSKYYGKYADKSDIPSTHKYCPRCDTVHARTAFYKDSNNKDGLAGYCKVCQDNRSKAWQRANRDVINTRRRGLREKDPIAWEEEKAVQRIKAKLKREACRLNKDLQVS